MEILIFFSINSNTLTSVNGDRRRRRTDDATLTVSLGKKDFMPIGGNNNNNNKNSREKLRIISLKDKPKGWTGKT